MNLELFNTCTNVERAASIVDGGMIVTLSRQRHVAETFRKQMGCSVLRPLWSLTSPLVFECCVARVGQKFSHVS